MSKRDSPDDFEEPPTRRPFVLRPAEEAVGVTEAEARLARREATRALNARREAAAAFVVDVDAPNTEDFHFDRTLEVQVVAVQQTVRREQRIQVICAEGKDSEDDEDEERELLPHEGLSGTPEYVPTAYMPSYSPEYVPTSPAYMPSYSPEYVPTSPAYMPEDGDFIHEDGNSGYDEDGNSDEE
jgi:hypothetical protein